MLIRTSIGLGLCAFSALVGASELDLTLGRDSLRGEFVTAVGPKVADNVPTLDLGLLYREDDDADGTLVHVGLLIFGDAGAPKANIQAGVGARGVLFDADPGLNGGALALGGTISARLPDFDRLGARLTVYYAPDVSAFGDLADYFEYGIGLDYQLIRQAFVVAGYRQIRLGISDAPRIDIESGGYAGLRLVF